MNLEQLVREDFDALIGASFTVPNFAGPALALRLDATGAAGVGVPGGRAPFSLVFAGPRAPFLPQGIQHLEHTTLGGLDIFLVPLGPRGEEMLYEAIFS